MDSQKKSKTEQELPKWFKGMVYREGAEVTNTQVEAEIDLSTPPAIKELEKRLEKKLKKDGKKEDNS